ncbi:MAG TPA: hypothetical protein VEJ44_05350, partial [Acidimicrobiales bacterium]|nr:hypothetical protein [Acidimicrobiales bacterium]
VFDCGRVSRQAAEAIVLPPEEIGEHRWVSPAEAAGMLSGPVGRRVRHCIGRTGTVYLEDGHTVAGVSVG